MANDKAASPHVAERVSAMQLGRASYRLSAVGIMVGIVLTIIVIALRASGTVHDQYHY